MIKIFKNNQYRFEQFFYVSCYEFIRNAIIISHNNKLLMLLLSKSQHIIILNLDCLGLFNDFKISLQISNLKVDQNNKLIIQGFNSISINYLKVEKQIFLDESLIEINQNFQIKSIQYPKQIVGIQSFKKIFFYKCYKFIASLFSFESNTQINISLQNISYCQNIFHSYLNYLISISANLLQITSSLFLLKLMIQLVIKMQ
ncbi:unnamed protein product [Paramecium pentaurelia]|uniref:Transmembrane protein n=1 Tax=Paramecium pentaurelia TaxID=43138 RepID=A0A8S1WNH6_9CILI|nr:unnamed protein product [Paramecium pentaurelia]